MVSGGPIKTDLVLQVSILQGLLTRFQGPPLAEGRYHPVCLCPSSHSQPSYYGAVSSRVLPFPKTSMWETRTLYEASFLAEVHPKAEFSWNSTKSGFGSSWRG